MYVKKKKKTGESAGPICERGRVAHREFCRFSRWPHRACQRACTGKRPVSRGEAPSAFNSGSDEASFTSGVPHHMPPDLAVSAPLLSHRPTPVGSLVKGGVKGRGDDDDKGGGGRQQTRHNIYIYIYSAQKFGISKACNVFLNKSLMLIKAVFI